MYATVDPATGAVVHEFPTLTDADAGQALAAAARAYRTWSVTTLAERAAVLAHMAALHREKAEELAALTTLEMGKPIVQARAEVELAASIYEYYATSGPDLLKDEVLDIAGTGQALVRTAPIGPLLGIMPWNFPLYQAARFIAPNLLLGNTILLKHAPNCPQLSLAIEAIAAETAPDDVYQNIFATHEQIATMIASPLLQGVSLTGSERAGRIIGALAGGHLKKCVLELGGSDPLIVLPQADLEQAVSAAAIGRFWNAGQVCTSMKRAIVAEPVWDEFVTRFLEEAATWHTGDPSDEATRLGPLSSVAARDQVAEQVHDAVTKGAKLHLGGEVPKGAGAYYPATVLSDVTPEMRVYHEEVFGPVAVLHRVDSTDAAIDLANSSPYGLGGAVFTKNVAEAEYVANRLDVGMVGLNMLVRSSPEMPFGGVKNSGIGRELGRFGLDEFANKKLFRTP
ncbi:NAD-dependent succinate-semialdehyde dehydrogenase [Streptomyces sp. NPDC058256]|uniref:NAD-dependent succinate-semialdehyde dehydrogenase n=1 Tax=Streptomyces sp. NPDC058256 TaxID=3346408 RepID=UPI0036E45151